MVKPKLAMALPSIRTVAARRRFSSSRATFAASGNGRSAREREFSGRGLDVNSIWEAFSVRSWLWSRRRTRLWTMMMHLPVRLPGPSPTVRFWCSTATVRQNDSGNKITTPNYNVSSSTVAVPPPPPPITELRTGEDMRAAQTWGEFFARSGGLTRETHGVVLAFARSSGPGGQVSFRSNLIFSPHESFFLHVHTCILFCGCKSK